MLLGTIALQSAARTTGATIPTDYTMFVFDDALGLTQLGSTTKMLKVASLAKNTHGVARVAKLAGKRIEKRQRATQGETIAELPPDLTARQLSEHFEDAHCVSTDAIESLKATTGMSPLALRGVLLQFEFTSKDAVDPYMYKRLCRQRQVITADIGPGMELLCAVLGDKVADKRRAWGKN